MIADVNLIGALGSTPGAPQLQESGVGEPATNFAALMDEATAAVPVPAAVPARATAAFELPVDATLFADWWLGAADVSDALHQLREEAARSEEGQSVDEESPDEETETANMPLEGVLNIDWLFARPQRLAIYAAPAGETPEGKASASSESQPAPTVDAPPPAAGPHGDAATVLAKLGEGKAVEPPVAATDGEALVDAAETFEKAVRSAFDPAPARKAEPASVADKADAEKAQAEKTNRPLVEAVVAKAAAAPESAATAMTRAEDQVLQASEAQVEPAPRQTTAASRLARAIERLGGASAEAAEVVRAAQAPQHESPSDGAMRGFSSSPQHEATSAAPGRAQSAAPVFTIPAAPDVRHAADVLMPRVDIAAALPVEIPEADTVRQLVQTMRMQFRDGIGDAVVRLRPEHLGEVSISLRVEQGSVSATVQAEVAAVRHWLETHEGTLRSNLAEQGLHLEKFVVREDGAQQQHGDGQDPQRKRQSRRQARLRQGEAEPQFEVTV
jgi:flagellar hook-length control protein FliK